ncbi:MAG: hypothetical protein GY913_21755 [Proteobacteria bacterium]|nr:hypothetical protein [Actinomycetes bacterium]MCP4919536.1 hypothetical protein [Pseudomonadota bacterium]
MAAPARNRHALARKQKKASKRRRKAQDAQFMGRLWRNLRLIHWRESGIWMTKQQARAALVQATSGRVR